MTKELLKQLEQKTGLSFRSKKLLFTALAHPSYQSNNASNRSPINFQRLEFLGDAILNFFIARKLYSLFPEANEGLLSRLRSTLVSQKLLARISRSMSLISFLLVGKREQLPFALAREKVLADAFEALIAAIYLDRGLKATEQFLWKHFERRLDQKKLFRFDPNPKSTLQEYVQKRFHILPSYQPGAQHRNRFTTWVSIRGTKKTKGEGRTRQEAEVCAAANLLRKLKVRKQFSGVSSRKEAALKG